MKHLYNAVLQGISNHDVLMLCQNIVPQNKMKYWESQKFNDFACFNFPLLMAWKSYYCIFSSFQVDDNFISI